MQFAVTDIEFDFDDSCYDISPLMFEDERDAVDLALGTWTADDEDDLIEEITAATGWCIRSIDYHIVLK